MGDVRFVARGDRTAFAKARPYAYANEVSGEANSGEFVQTRGRPARRGRDG